MEDYQIKANEQFFINVLNLLHEHGVWVWKDKSLLYKKVGNKLTASTEDLEHIQNIVSSDFFSNHFVSIT